MKNHIFFVSLLVIGVGVAGLSIPVQAARLVPGSAPTTTPLQPLPPDISPNYNGSINFQSLPNNAEVDKPNQNPQDEMSPLSKTGTQLIGKEFKRHEYGKWQFVGLVIVGLGLVYAYIYFKKKLR